MYCMLPRIGATMGSQLLLRWDNHLPSFACSMKECLDDGDLTDLTISCQGRVLRCHKLVLSVASPHFKQLLKVSCEISLESCDSF